MKKRTDWFPLLRVFGLDRYPKQVVKTTPTTYSSLRQKAKKGEGVEAQVEGKEERAY